jgi:predicted helicase
MSFLAHTNTSKANRMLHPDLFIGSCTAWSEFWEGTKQLSSTSDKGAVFERLTQLYLQTAPEYQSELEHIWALRDVRPKVRKRLALPTLDEGIDFIAQTRHGKYWAIQSKFRSQHDKPLTRTELGTFSSLAFNTCSNIDLAVVAHTASKPISKRHLMRNTTEIGLDRWQSLDQDAWSLIVGKLKGRSAAPKARMPRPHQSAAVAAAKTHFVHNGAARGRLIMPCGTGKSLTAYWIAEALEAKTILVAVPSLALVRQSLTDWTREFLAHASSQIGFVFAAMRRSATSNATKLLARFMISACPRTLTLVRLRHCFVPAPTDPRSYSRHIKAAPSWLQRQERLV